MRDDDAPRPEPRATSAGSRERDGSRLRSLAASVRRPDRCGDDRGITPVIAVVAMVAVSATLAAVLGTWMLFGDSPVEEQVSAQVSLAYTGGDAVVTWTNEGDAERLRVVVGTRERVIEEVDGVVKITAAPERTLVVVAERADGESSIIARTRLEDVN